MTRVCHMTSVHPWDDVRIYHKECRSLAEAGFDVHLVACGPESLAKDGVTLHAIPRAKGGRLARILKTAWQIYRAAKAVDADIYHLHDPELLPYGLLLVWQGKKVIYDAHEDVPRDILSKAWIAPWLRRLIAQTFEIFEDWAASRLSAIVAATPHIAQRFSALNPRAIDINNYPMQSELSDGLSAHGGERTVCYVGGISRIRGAVEMVAAMEKVDARLVLAGPFESASLEAELRGMPGWGKVDYRGSVSRDEVRRIFSESSIGLLFLHPEPNYLYAQPIKMFEYMSAGLPVAASNFPLWRQLLTDTGAGICADPLSPSAIAGVINELLDNPEQAKAMGQAGRQAVLTTYRWETEVRKLANLYGELANE